MLGGPDARHPDGDPPARRVRPGPAARRPRGRAGDRHLPGAGAVAGGVRGPAGTTARPADAGHLVGCGPRVGHAAAADGARPSRTPGSWRSSARPRCRRSRACCSARTRMRKLGSVGKVDPDGRRPRRRRRHERRARSGRSARSSTAAPTLMAGYWNNPQATAEAFAGGWFHSGDLVRMDDEGYVWVVDRKKDMIISGGENIYCAEVENVLAGSPGDRRGGRDRPGTTTSGARCRSPSRPSHRSRSTTEDLDEFLNERLARYKHPEGTRDRRRVAAQPGRQGLEDRIDGAIYATAENVVLRPEVPQQSTDSGPRMGD